MGDPNGIGPEIIVKALGSPEIKDICRIVVFADAEVLDRACGITGYKINYEIDGDHYMSLNDIKPGEIDIKAGHASLKSIFNGVKSVLERKTDALVTAPISKEAIHIAGSEYPGHTEMLADLTGSENVAMMFEGSMFKVVLVTIHNALNEVPGLLTTEKIFNIIELADKSLRRFFDIPEPKIVVCGLNPHAGESGAFGTEEIHIIKPAIERAANNGINIEGPLPADTLFYYAAQGKWDLVVAMYHDQGLIPFKMINFEKGVNVTLGLPIIRTSPDHGTAFDISWQGKANPSSLIEAIKLAVRMYRNSN